MQQISRNGVIYEQLPDGTLTCGALDQSGMVGGSGEQDRNEGHNPERMQRILQFHPNPKVLDFGCGNGLFVEYLQNQGVDAWGYDKYSLDGNLVKAGYDVVSMIEVIEHTSAPYSELETILDILKPGGILMVETSFTDWMDLQTDTYINPAIGHCTIFSHQGLDDLMADKGFRVYGHINRNVRVYQKPPLPFNDKITLVTMGQANPRAFRRTVHSFKGHIDEVIFGDVLIFDADREAIEHAEYPVHTNIVKLPFNYIFENGFGATLNKLASDATNDWILYMNVSEVMDGEHSIKKQMSGLYNCYPFDHAVDPHRWFRLYNRKEVRWGGLIHEEVVGDLRPCPYNVFRMMDTEKDMDDPFKAKVSNDVKELCYFNQYVRMVEHPELRGSTHQGWIDYATQSYDSLKERLLKKGRRYQAFQEGNLSMYLEDVYTSPEFEEERFKSSDLINFQGDRKLL